MKSKRFLLLGFLASSLCLAGCGNDDNKGKEDGEKNPPATLLETLKEKARIIAAKVFETPESDITFADFEGEDSADVYFYDSPNLTFVDIEMYDDTYDTSLADNLKSHLPSNVTLYDNKDDFEYEEYGMMFYDRYYKDSEFTYNVYVEAYDEYEEDPAETYGSIFIFKTSQEDAFNEYMTLEE